MASIYQINKGINKPIEFKGLKAQYISYLAIGLVALLILFAVMYIVGINMFICLAIIAISGSILFIKVFALSHKYGEYGLLKKAAKRCIPTFIRFKSRNVFIQLNQSNNAKIKRRNHG